MSRGPCQFCGVLIEADEMYDHEAACFDASQEESDYMAGFEHREEG